MGDDLIVYGSKNEKVMDAWWHEEGMMMCYNGLAWGVGWAVQIYLWGALAFFLGKIVSDILHRDWKGMKSLAFATFGWPVWFFAIIVIYSKKARNTKFMNKVMNG